MQQIVKLHPARSPVGRPACKLVVTAVFGNPCVSLFPHIVHGFLLRRIGLVQRQGCTDILQDSGLQRTSFLRYSSQIRLTLQVMKAIHPTDFCRKEPHRVLFVNFLLGRLTNSKKCISWQTLQQGGCSYKGTHSSVTARYVCGIILDSISRVSVIVLLIQLVFQEEQW